MHKPKSGSGGKKTAVSSRKKTVAQYLTEVMDSSEKSQVSISQAIGFQSSNVLTLIKKGRTKLPINRIPDLARLLEIDPYDLLKRAMTEYSPQVWAAIEEVISKKQPDHEEEKILAMLREAAEGELRAPVSPEDVAELKAMAKKWGKKRQAKK